MQSREVILDVGANKGEFALDLLARNLGVRAVAIEPIPELCEKIRNGAEQIGRSFDIEILQCAVDMQERTADFNVADHADQGVSSLLNLSGSEVRQDNYWSTRTDLYFDKTIQVRVRRLDSILTELRVSHIAFMKIDVQGLDLQVLRSMGKYLECLDAGMLEVASTLDKKLYHGEEFDLRRALHALDDMGFEVYSIKPNDPASNEFNLFFCRKGIDYRVLEQRLNLRQIPLYSGKDFWHAPSAQYRPLQEMSVEQWHKRIADMDAEIFRLNARIEQQDALITSTDAEIFRLNARIEQQDALITSKDAEIFRLNARIEQQDALITSMDAEIFRLNARAEQQGALIASQQQGLQQAEKQLGVVYASMSWAVTWPLRLVSTGIRALLGRCS